MPSNNSFYLTLPSNSSAQLFPDNTLTHFRTQLAHPVCLEGSWECGLSEIYFPRTWFNVIKANNAIHIIPAGAEDNRLWTKVTIPHGHYESGEALVDALNKKISSQVGAGNGVQLVWCKRTERITVNILENGAKMRTVGMLALMMGFEHRQVIKATTTAFRAYDPEGGVYALFLYCNIIQPSFVGDTHVPLLRIVPIKGSVGQMVAYRFEKPHYHPVSCKQFQTVEIDIRDSEGEPVAFQRGTVIVKLHLRKNRS